MNAPTITGFDIIRKLGEGGMATVWLARQISLNREVALKVLLPRFAVSPDEVARFQSESQAAAKLKHPGIVQVYDAGIVEGRYFFVMEYIAGYTAGDWVRRKGLLSEHDALLVAENVSEALDYAWENARIIHCDIKPDNVMIDKDGTVKVTDLGLARTLTAMEERTEQDDDHVLGTPAYMAPEQARGDAFLDFRADIYALGAMLYKLTTGRRLFQEADAEETLDLQIHGRVPDALDLRPGLSKPVCWLMERLLAKNPALRGESWAAVRSDIRRVYKGLMPRETLNVEDKSTMDHSLRRCRTDYQNLDRLVLPPLDSRCLWQKLALGAALVAIVAFLLQLYIRFSADPVLPPHTPALHQKATARKFEAMYEAATQWDRENPDRPDEAVVRYEVLEAEAAGTGYEALARARIQSLQAATQRLREARIQRLHEQLEALEHEGAYGKAEEYIIAFGDETPQDEHYRQRLLKELRRRREAKAAEKKRWDFKILNP